MEIEKKKKNTCVQIASVSLLTFAERRSALRWISIMPLKVTPLYNKIFEHAQYQLLHKTTCFYFIRATQKKVDSL